MRHKHLLIVDDNEDILFFLACGIQQMWPHYEVATAVDSSTALEQLEKSSFDLMLIDYKLPGMNGLELARMVCEIAPQTQIVMMSAHKSIDLEDRMAMLKLAGFVGKPFLVSEIQKFIPVA